MQLRAEMWRRAEMAKRQKLTTQLSAEMLLKTHTIVSIVCALWTTSQREKITFFFFVCVSLGNLYNKASWIGGRAKEAHSTFSLCHTRSALFPVNFSSENWARPSHYNQIPTCHPASPLAAYAHAFPAVFSRQLERYTANICVTRALILYKFEVTRPERRNVSCVKPFTTRNKWETQYIKCHALIEHVGEKV